MRMTQLTMMHIKEFLSDETPKILTRMQQAVADGSSVTLHQDEALVIIESMTQLIQVLGKTSMVLQQVLEKRQEETETEEETMH